MMHTYGPVDGFVLVRLRDLLHLLRRLRLVVVQLLVRLLLVHLLHLLCLLHVLLVHLLYGLLVHLLHGHFLRGHFVTINDGAARLTTRPKKSPLLGAFFPTLAASSSSTGGQAREESSE